MSSSSKVIVYIACSLDGFIAGDDDDLSWLPGATPDGEEAPEVDPTAVQFEPFISSVGALLMGRRTYDVVKSFGGEWPYGSRPVLIATHREIVDAPEHVSAVDGDIESMVAAAKKAADGKHVYLDGGNLIRQALDANLIDELIVTLVPVVLGSGHSLFAGAKRHPLKLISQHRFSDQLTQLVLRPETNAGPDV